MSIYAGLDVSDKTTHICVVDVEGKVLRRDVVASDPDVLAKWLNQHCAGLVRVVLETGTLSTFLYHGLAEHGVPVECICARHDKGVLSVRINKSDVHDAEGLAQLARTGWFKRVHMKASATHIDGAALRIRAQLITARTSMANQLRGLLKLFGLRIGTARTPGRRAERLTALYSQRPDLKALFAPLIASMETIEEQLRASSRLLGERATADPVCARLMGELIQLAEQLADRHHIHRHAWHEACRVMGQRGAAASVIATVRKYQTGEVERPGAYLRGMSGRAAKGELNLGRTFHGLKDNHQAVAMKTMQAGGDPRSIGEIARRTMGRQFVLSGRSSL